MNVVVVESPAKAKTINRYLGSDYKVVASYGHVRDLPSKDGSVRPDADFAMEWEVDAKARKHIKEIASALKGSTRLFLATDPDREGEAISWHVREVLEEGRALEGVEVKRVVFNEITKSAVIEAFRNPRELDHGLVDAYLARRALDYLVGFTLSPILWRKLPGSRSAGRVQSVALRLICERENEIEDFRPREYWTVEGRFATADGKPLAARMTHLEGQKLGKFSLADEAAASAAVAAVEGRDFQVAEVERKRTKRHPAPPFTTSTLQQEASRKLRLPAKRTMQLAQRLYEGINLGGETVGLITYMRTDSVQMAGEAVEACRRRVVADFGGNFIPSSPRFHRSKAKNAQEAHEAIRPTDVDRHPSQMARHLDKEQARLYELIWKRALASQMESALIDQVAVDIAPTNGAGGGGTGVVLRATGSTVAFEGFLKLYEEGRDEPAKGNGEGALPAVERGQALDLEGVGPEQHFTQPPPRYGEASLVKRLEELGIGRPSTYASIISVLQDREYVRLEKRRFIPEDRGRLVTAFLTSFFERYVEYDFTADMERKLDDISGGRIHWKTVLREFWTAFDSAVGDIRELATRQVLDALDGLLGPHFFQDDGTGADPRACPLCDDGRLGLKLGKFGAFIGCSNYPECRHTRPLVAAEGGGEGGAAAPEGTRVLGTDPESGDEVTLRKGPYGWYVQLGDGSGKEKPKRSSLDKGRDTATVDLAIALALLSLPREIGSDPESGDTISAGIGRYGPYLKRGGTYLSLKEDDVLTVGLNRAVTLLADAPRRAEPSALGEHPGDGKPVTLRAGRYGPYVQHGTLRATLPKSMSDRTPTLKEAVELLKAKAAKGGGRKGGGRKKTAKKKK